MQIDLSCCLFFYSNLSDTIAQLYQPYGGNTYIEPALKVPHADGVLSTELSYVGTETKRIDDNVTEIIVKLKDDIYPLYVNVIFKTYNKENIISQSVRNK